MHKNLKGFALVESLLIFIIVGMIGGVGWYVWNSKKKTDSNFSNASAASSSELPKVEPIDNYEECVDSKVSTKDTKAFPVTCTTKAGKKFIDPNPYAEWKTYDSAIGRYSLKYPTAWNADVCEPAATDLALYLGPTKASSVLCGSEHPSQIIVLSTPAVPTASEQVLPDTYIDQKTEQVTVDGVVGTRQSGKLKAAEEFSNLPAGTIVVRYVFLVPGRSFIIVYAQAPAGDYAADNLNYFDRVVKDTMKFKK